MQMPKSTPKNNSSQKANSLNQDVDAIEGEMLESHVIVRIAYGFLVLSGLLFIGTMFYINFEKWSWIDALYFSAQTLTTVGYGNITPTTDISKLFTVAYMIFGVGVALYILSSVAAEILKRREIEWLEQARKGRLKHLGHLHKHIKIAAGKFKYDKFDIGLEEDVEKKKK